MVRTLNNMAELRASRFGRPSPRHGLKLLFWFAKDYIFFDNENQMVANYIPEEENFGFHHFQNRLECDNNVCKKLLPDDVYPFYEVGNLHLTASYSMPEYVRKDYTGHIDNSNMDRLIISMRPDRTVDKVYVTQHEDLRSFDPVNTYRLSRGILMIIHRHSSLEVFLEQACYSTHAQIPFTSPAPSPSPSPAPSPSPSHAPSPAPSPAPRESSDIRINMGAGSRALRRAKPGHTVDQCTIL